MSASAEHAREVQQTEVRRRERHAAIDRLTVLLVDEINRAAGRDIATHGGDGSGISPISSASVSRRPGRLGCWT
jgi:hypothetical protein